MENISHVFTVLCGQPPEKAHEVIVRNRAYCEFIGVDFIVHPFTVPQGHTMLQAADRARFVYAAENPSTLYVDWDCLIIDFPRVNPDYAMFPFMNSDGVFDYYCFYASAEKDLFKRYVEYHDRTFPNNSAPDYWTSLQGFFKGKIQNYPPATYRHYSLRGWEPCNQ